MAIGLAVLGILLSAFVGVMIVASAPNSTPVVAAQLRNFGIVVLVGGALALVGVPIAAFLGRPPLAMTLAMASVLTAAIVFLGWWEFGSEPLPPDYRVRTGKLIVRCLVLLIFGGGGLMMFYVGAREYRFQKLLLADAVEVDVEIIKSEVFRSQTTDTDHRVGRDNSTVSYRPDVTFRYTLDGKTYESELIRPSAIGQSYASPDNAMAEIKPFPVGAKMKGFASRAMPERGYLVRESSPGPVVFLIVGTLLGPIAQVVGRWL